MAPDYSISLDPELEAVFAPQPAEPTLLPAVQTAASLADEPITPFQTEERVSEPDTSTEPTQTKWQQAVSTGPGDFSSDDPNSPDYKFRDAGYVFGSRKELASLEIRTAAKEGRLVRSADINWVEIEANPREARGLITKSLLFGEVDWEALKAGGMTPGAGFLVDRVYAAIGKEPSEDSPTARRDYALGLETLRDRLEACETVEDVTKALDALRELSEGFSLSESEQAAYDAAGAQHDFWWEKQATYREAERKLEAPFTKVDAEISQLEWDQKKRERRRWSRDPELDARLETLKPQREEHRAALDAFKALHPDAQDRCETVQTERGTATSFGSTYNRQAHAFSREMGQIKKTAAIRNLVENPLCRAWARMGDRFIGVLYYRSHKGSDAFQGHVATAKAGKIADWSWAEKQVTRVATSTKESLRFQLKVADKYDRSGGRDRSDLKSSADLKAAFGLKAVELGLWVAEDFNSAKFHVERCAEGFADLADLLGVQDREVSLGGRLSVGFGSRGQGAIGWRTSAPAASYFPKYQVINLTKMAGGGTLAHEWLHGLDNILPELATGKPARVEVFATENPDILPEGPLRDAMKGFVAAMTVGPYRHDEKITYSGRDVIVARHNIDRQFSSYGGPRVAQRIKDAGNVSDAVIAVREVFGEQRDRDGNITRRAKTAMKDWATLAAAYYGAEAEGGTILVKAGQPTSRFLYEAVRLDSDSKTPYWQTRRELAARAFQSYCEDRLSDLGRQNDYLSWHADNRFYVDPIFGPLFPYPEGEERVRINAALDHLVAEIRAAGLLAPQTPAEP